MNVSRAVSTMYYVVRGGRELAPGFGDPIASAAASDIRRPHGEFSLDNQHLDIFWSQCYTLPAV